MLWGTPQKPPLADRLIVCHLHLQTNMENLIERTLQWGNAKGITGPAGTGTPHAQATKMLEEANETFDAVDFADMPNVEHSKIAESLTQIKDGIGDTCVTLILLAEMYGWTLAECLSHALEIIEKRTGKMVGGNFVKDQ